MVHYPRCVFYSNEKLCQKMQTFYGTYYNNTLETHRSHYYSRLLSPSLTVPSFTLIAILPGKKMHILSTNSNLYGLASACILYLQKETSTFVRSSCHIPSDKCILHQVNNQRKWIRSVVSYPLSLSLEFVKE